MTASQRITVDDLDLIGGLVPRRARHRLAHYLNRRLHYAIDSPGRCPPGFRQPYTRAEWEHLPGGKRVEVLTGHLVSQ